MVGTRGREEADSLAKNSLGIRPITVILQERQKPVAESFPFLLQSQMLFVLMAASSGLNRKTPPAKLLLTGTL